MADVERIARLLVDAWNANDWGTLERHSHPEIVIRTPPIWPEASDSNGWPEVRAQYELLKETFVEERIEIIEIEAFGDEIVLEHLRWIAHGASGLPMDLENWNVHRFAGDQVIRIDYYLDEVSARRALAAAKA